jgi:hypothetical protein
MLCIGGRATISRNKQVPTCGHRRVNLVYSFGNILRQLGKRSRNLAMFLPDAL